MPGTLFLIGLGLGDQLDITIRGKEAMQSCSSVFLDAYTSILGTVDVAQMVNLKNVNSELI